MRIDYAGPYKSATHADERLSDFYATGEVCDGERPDIEARKIRIAGKVVTRYYVTLAVD